MALSFTNLIINGSTSVTSSYNTASVSPTANRLILLTVINSHGSAATLPTVTGASMTWAQVRTKLRSNSTARITVFRCMSSSVGSGALTIDFGGTNQNNCGWCVDQSGTDIFPAMTSNGADAIIQSADNETAASNSSLTVTLGTFANNSTYGPWGAIRVGGNPAVTPGSGFNEIAENAATAASLETEYKPSNDTTVDWSYTGVGAISMGIALEIATAPIGGSSLMMMGV